MADMRDRLIELLKGAETKVTEQLSRPLALEEWLGIYADHLLANGVTVRKSLCPYCCDDGEGHGRLANSYDDYDGMTMSIHPSRKRENGYQSQAWWATVHFRGECRDFYIEVCPFCGRRLVPLKEEYEAGCP